MGCFTKTIDEAELVTREELKKLMPIIIREIRNQLMPALLEALNTQLEKNLVTKSNE